MTDPSTGRIAAGMQNLVADPGQAAAHIALARACSEQQDFARGTRALIRALVISRPPIEAVRVTLEQVMFHPQPRAMALLWRMADEAATYMHEELLEREVASRTTITESERRNYLRYLFRRRDLARDSLPYVICGMPKSASTFVSGLVSEMTGLPMDDPHSYNESFMFGLDKGLLGDLCQRDVVVHGHLAANPRSVCYLRLLKARPIVTVRNIFDALRSYVDHVFPSRQVDPEILPTLLNNVILQVGAFYVEFYATWYRARRQLDTLLVHFDDIQADPLEVVDRVAAHLGSGASAEGIARARAMAAPGGLDDRRRKALQYNRGVSGRGCDLAEEQRAMVRSLYYHYGDVDFRPIDPEFERRV
jgi:hypothetical protein